MTAWKSTSDEPLHTPNRNQPEIKDTKTGGSKRTIALSAAALPYLCMDGGRFLFGGDKPLSYTQVRRMCNRIKKDLKFEENITPIRFRTTVLTDLYEQTGDIKLAQAEAGHTTRSRQDLCAKLFAGSG